MQQWLIYRSNNTHGPFTPAQLKQLADDGKIRPSDIVGLVGSEERFQAIKVGGLFDGTIVSSVSSPEQSAGDATRSKLYVRVKGRALGPFTHEHLQKMATSGKLNRLSELSEDGSSWAKAESFGIRFGTKSPTQSSQNYSHGDSSTSASPVSSAQSEPKHTEVAPKDWHVHVGGENYGPMSQHELNGFRHAIQQAFSSDSESHQNATSQQWFIQKNGIKTGPFDEQSIRAQMNAGQLGPADLICSIEGNTWDYAQKFFDYQSNNSVGYAPQSQQVVSSEGLVPPPITHDQTEQIRDSSAAATAKASPLSFAKWQLPLIMACIFACLGLYAIINTPGFAFNRLFINSPTSKLTTDEFRSQVAWKSILTKEEFFEKWGTPISITNTGGDVYLNYQCKDANVMAKAHATIWRDGAVYVFDVLENF